jgi:hypothetical protein
MNSKIMSISMGLLLIGSTESSAMGQISRVGQRTEQLGARVATLPSRAQQGVYGYWTKFKSYFGVSKPASVQEQVMPFANYPITYGRLYPMESPVTMVDQSKLVDPFLKTEKVLSPLALSIAALSTVALTSGDLGLMGAGALLGIVPVMWWKALPYTSNPFLAARSILKQTASRFFLTDAERLKTAASRLLSGEGWNIDPSEFPADIIDKPLFEGGLTLLQYLLQKTDKMHKASTLIAFTVSYGADPQQHADNTLHPITIVLNAGFHWDRFPTLLALVNPYITRYRNPIPADIVGELRNRVSQERVRVRLEIDKSLNDAGLFVLSDYKKTDLADQLLVLNQIEEALVLRGNMKASEVKNPFAEEL